MKIAVSSFEIAAETRSLTSLLAENPPVGQPCSSKIGPPARRIRPIAQCETSGQPSGVSSERAKSHSHNQLCAARFVAREVTFEDLSEVQPALRDAANPVWDELRSVSRSKHGRGGSQNPAGDCHRAQTKIHVSSAAPRMRLIQMEQATNEVVMYPVSGAGEFVGFVAAK